MRISGPFRKKNIYVDAKITGMHSESMERTAYVGFISEDDSLHDAAAVAASETDEAEASAILFAIKTLRRRLRSFTVICDHESVVQKANWKGKARSSGKNSQVFLDLWRELDEGSVVVQPLKTNPAHRFLNKWVKERESKPQVKIGDE